MINLDSITNENNKEHNEKWLYIPDHLYKIIIIGGFGSSKTNALINLINEQSDLSEPKYKYLIKKREEAGIKHLNNPNAFIECSNTMDVVYENINDIDYQHFRKIYGECTKEPFYFLRIDHTLPASDPLRLRKNWFDPYENDKNWSD